VQAQNNLTDDHARWFTQTRVQVEYVEQQGSRELRRVLAPTDADQLPPPPPPPRAPGAQGGECALVSCWLVGWLVGWMDGVWVGGW
jgi:hypothetical protein